MEELVRLIEKHYQIYQSQRYQAEIQLGDIRNLRLGDINFPESFFRSLLQLFQNIFSESKIRNKIFRDYGGKARVLLIVLMSELIYREYERGFWKIFYSRLRVDSSYYSWITGQMVRAYVENNIVLITSGYGYNKRNEYVRTIILESGFSKALVNQAKNFVIWFYEKFPDYDPRLLNKDRFERVLDEFGIDNKDEVIDLLREMVRSVGKLLREIRNRSLTSIDLIHEDEELLRDIQVSLGFHPIRGIFGFRNSQDIINLIEALTYRIQPHRLENTIRKEIQKQSSEISVLSPDGKQISLKDVKGISAVYGKYLFQNEKQIIVVPREAISFSHLASIINTEPNKFHEDSRWLYIHAKESFEIIQRKRDVDYPRKYYISQKGGYLWYGNQSVGASLSAERDGEVIDYHEPRIGLGINPRLRLNKKRNTIILSIPSFTLFDPTFSGQTVRLELNGLPIDRTTYIVSDRGGLQLQGTRIADIDLSSERLVLEVISVVGRDILARKSILKTNKTSLLFSKGNRELVNPGEREMGGRNFLLFNGTEHEPNFKSVRVHSTCKMGNFKVYDIEWQYTEEKSDKSLMIEVGELKWVIRNAYEAFFKISSVSNYETFIPKSTNAFFSLDDFSLQVNFVSDFKNDIELSKFSILVEKDFEVIDNISFVELEQLRIIHQHRSNEIEINKSKLIKRFFDLSKITEIIGTYTFTLFFQKSSSEDVEIMDIREFLILPELEIDLPEFCFDGQENFATIKSFNPVLIDAEDNIGSVIQEKFIPKVEFDLNQKVLVSKSVEKAVRISNPATKLAVNIIPDKVISIRLLKGIKAFNLDGLTIEKFDLDFASLLILAPSGNLFQLEVDGIVENINLGEFPLRKISKWINKPNSQLKVNLNGAPWKSFSVFWHTKFQLHYDNCYLESDIESTNIIIEFDIDGPSEQEIVVKVTDNKLRPYGPFVYQLEDLKSGIMKINLENEKISDAAFLYCTVLINDNSVGKIKFRVQAKKELDIVDNKAEKQEIILQINSQMREIKRAENSILKFIELYENVKTLEQGEYSSLILKEMYSKEMLDIIRNKVRKSKISREILKQYFSEFSKEYFPNIDENLIIHATKTYFRIDVPELSIICAEKLIERNDGIGVEEIIEDLMVNKKIDWNQAMISLRINPDLAVERIIDIVQLEDIENRSEEYIDTFIKVGAEFHPPIVGVARAAKVWKKAKHYCLNKEIISAKIVDFDASGVVVPFDSITGKIPVNEIDWERHNVRRVNQNNKMLLRQLINEETNVVITMANRKERKLIFSELKASKIFYCELMERIKPNNVVQGVITNVTEFGAFVDLGGISGLVHKSEISWDWVEHPSVYLQKGDEVIVKILTVDNLEKKINLSIKRVKMD
ncbi:S1 RNA-binding domain-containing protein [Chloroflexota bacterium]